jgi:general secretion pathway protein L
MAERFFAFLTETGPGAGFVRGDGGAVRAARRNERPGGQDELILFVPGADVSCHRAELGARITADVLKAAAFAVEDELAVPAEDVHAAIGPERSGSSARDVYVVAADRMTAWMAAAQGFGAGRFQLVPDYSVLPDRDCTFDLGTHMIGKRGGRGFALDKSWPEDVQGALLGHQPAEQVADALALLARLAGERTALVDLRSGRFAHRSAAALSAGQARLPVLLAASLGVLLIGEALLSTAAMGRLTKGLQADAAARYGATHPGAALPAAPGAAKTGADTGAVKASFRDLSGVLYGAMDASPGARLIAMRFDADTGELRATLLYPSFGADQALKSAIEGKGLSVRLGEARTQNDRVLGDLVIAGPA